MEVNLVRPFVIRALEAFYKHDKPERDADRDARSSSSSSSRQPPREANNEPRVKSIHSLPHVLFFVFRFKRTDINLNPLFYRDL